MNTKAFIGNYLTDLKRLLSEIDANLIEEMVEALLDVWRNDRKVILMGNGGSSSSVSHIVNDLQKNIGLEAGKSLKTMCLSDCTPLIMAWANDTQWDNIFAPQITCWVEPKDVVIGVSGSGNSMNVIHGILEANRLGAKTFGLAGYTGGKLKQSAHSCLVVSSDNMQRIEDVHMAALHIVFSTVLERAKEEAKHHSVVKEATIVWNIPE